MFKLKLNRYGDDNLHSYTVGCYPTRAEAEFLGLCYEYYRGGKYEAQILEVEDNSNTLCTEDEQDKVIDFYFDQCGGHYLTDLVRISRA